MAISTEDDSDGRVLADSDAVVDDVVINKYIVNIRQSMTVPNTARDSIGHCLFACALTPHDGGGHANADRYVVGTEIGHRLVVREIDVMILRKVGIQRDVQQSIGCAD